MKYFVFVQYYVVVMALKRGNSNIVLGSSKPDKNAKKYLPLIKKLLLDGLIVY